MKQYREVNASTIHDPQTNTFIPKVPGNAEWDRVQREVAAGEAEILPKE
jgi:hypothetical protein